MPYEAHDEPGAPGDTRAATPPAATAAPRATASAPTATSARPRSVLVAVRSAGALHRLLDVLPVFRGDPRIAVRFTLVPGSEYALDALAALDRAGARTLPWEVARASRHDLVLFASPKGTPEELPGPRALLPHGAGFNKAVAGDGSPLVPSGLDPHHLLADGRPWADLYALAHEDQLARLHAFCPPAAPRARVVGDPTLDRLLASAAHREHYRAALGTGGRHLLALTSTWGPESLLARHPGLPAALAGLLPHDTYQLALILHPNTHSRVGAFDLARHLAPALSAGLVLAEPYEEWAALLVAADTVLTDHGSTALYAAALGRAVVGGYEGGRELVAGTAMDRLLDEVPALTGLAHLGAEDGDGTEAVEAALAAAARVDTVRLAKAAFARQGQSLAHLAGQLYGLLGIPAPAAPPEAPPLPAPAPPATTPPVFAVRTETDGEHVRVTRLAPHTARPAHHLAAAVPAAPPRHRDAAAVLWREPAPGAPPSTWTVDGWTRDTLRRHPLCRTAAAVLTPTRTVLRHRGLGAFTLDTTPARPFGRVLRPAPSAVVSAVHAWLTARPAPRGPVELRCEIGPLTVSVRVREASAEELAREL